MKRLLYSSLSLVCLLGTMSLLSGCSTSMSMPDTQGTGDFGVTKGGVFGGQNPITGAHVFVYETQSGGSYGTTSVKSLLGNTPSTLSPNGACNGNVEFPMIRVTAGTGGTPSAECYYQTGGYNGASGNQNTAVGNGEFNLTGLYKCDVGQEVWIFSINGWPDTTNADKNPYASLMADLGPCPSAGNFSADTYLYVNELSTVAMAYSVAAFTADTTTTGAGGDTGVNITISAPNSNTTGLINAFNNAQQLYNIEGLTDQPDLSAPHTTTYGARNGTPPYTLINTLGDIIAACINSTGNGGGLVTGSSCYELFLDVYGSTATVTDTASAMIHLAKNPLVPNPSNLISLEGTNPVWQPYYAPTAAPNDFTVAIAYSGAATYPYGMVLDPSGNAYVDDYATSGDMGQLSPLGAVTTTSGSTAIDDSAALAVDSFGLVWTASIGTGAIYYGSNTTSLSSVTVAEPTGTLAESVLKYPDIIAADTSGYVYIADPYGSDVYKTNHFGSSTNITESSTAGLDGCLTSATGVAVNHDGTLWVTSYGSPDNVCRMSNTGSAAYTLGASSGGFGSSGIISNADAVAAGSATSNGSGNTGGSGSAWVLDFTHADLYNVANSSTTTATETGPFSGGGMTAPVDLAVDGLGYVWVANNASGVGSISEFTPAGSPVTGSKAYQYDLLSSPSALGIDISGNVWVANTGSGNVIEVIGLAAPTQALVSGNPGTRP